MSVAVFIIVITTNSSSGSRNITITATTTIAHLSNWICANFISLFISQGVNIHSPTHHMPASNCTKPPYPYADATTKLGVVTPRVCMLIRLRTKVVRAKADRPSGAGLANLRCSTGRYRPGWNSPPKAGRRSPVVEIWARGPYPKRAAAWATSRSSLVMVRVVGSPLEAPLAKSLSAGSVILSGVVSVCVSRVDKGFLFAIDICIYIYIYL
ncbi:hypothetical protein I7I53_11513 [Histoplasma capsulatum var. duboisii H88]|uniref:Uncharacterized protein n=1 Tax=Ajellomyces capsulatus (strain H88) TaxID=544711 RepID=A0A8A1L8I8_AJEC8|nr:hypothetical protein I7I53_11513 [Histoplasma capsulatum var. duboisii H88]